MHAPSVIWLKSLVKRRFFSFDRETFVWNMCDVRVCCVDILIQTYLRRMYLCSQNKTNTWKARNRCSNTLVSCEHVVWYAKFNSAKTWFSAIDFRFIDVRQQVLYMFIRLSIRCHASRISLLTLVSLSICMDVSCSCFMRWYVSKWFVCKFLI